MFLVARLLQKIAWLRRSSMMRLSLLLSVIFAIGMAVAIFVALVLGQNAIERRIDTTLEALAKTAVLANSQVESPSMILRAADDLAGLPAPFRRAAASGRGTIETQRDFLRSDM